MSIDWVPTQEKQVVPVDYRNAKLGPKGYKERRKRKLEEQEEQYAQPVEMDQDVPTEGGGKRQKLSEGAPYQRVSGKTWKAPANAANRVMKPAVGRSWEKKMQEKKERGAFMEQKRAAEAAAKEKRQAKSKQRKDAKERKLVNQQKSTITQKITNSATVKKMLKNKKQKKLIKTADTS